MKAKDKQNIKKKLIECLAFLEVKAYKGIRNHCGSIVDIIDESEYNEDAPGYDKDDWFGEDDDDEPEDEDEW